MQTQWKDWLSAEKAAGRGGVVWPEPIVRGLPFSITLPFPLDVSGDAFKASLSNAPDSVSSPVDFTATVGSFAGGLTEVTFSLTGIQTAALLADGDGDGLEQMLLDALYTPAGGNASRMMAALVLISGQITEPA